MDYQKILLFLFITISISFGVNNLSEAYSLSPDKLTNELKTLENDKLLNLLKEVFEKFEFIKNELIINKIIIKEVKQRVPIEIDTEILIKEIKNKGLNTDYRKFLCYLLKIKVDELSLEQKLKILNDLASIINSRVMEKSIRTQAIKTSSKFLWFAKQEKDLSLLKHEDYSKIFMNLLKDKNENREIKVSAIKALKENEVKSFSVEFQNLIKIYESNDIPLTKALLFTLGEWKSSTVVPIATKILNNTKSQKLFDCAAYTLGMVVNIETIQSLLSNIRNYRDKNHVCKDVLNNNKNLIIELLKKGKVKSRKFLLEATKYIRGNPEELIHTLYNLLQSTDEEICLMAFKRLTRDLDKEIINEANEILNKRGNKSERIIKEIKTINMQIESNDIHLNRKNENRARPRVEVGDPVYRELGIIWGWVLEYNHAAIYVGHLNSLSKDRIIESNKDGNTVRYHNFTSMWDSGKDYFGAYKLSYDLDFNQRQDILSIAKQLESATIEYPYFFAGVVFPKCLVYSSNTSGKIDIYEIEELRCDGVVEYSFEVNGDSVWDQATTAGLHYDISHSKEWADEHNNGPDWTEECDKEMSPLAQRNACSGSNTNLKYSALSSIPTASYVYTPDKRIILTATDERSGIYCIRWKIGNGNWNSSPIQATYPQSNTQSQDFPMPQANTVYLEIEDNAGNIGVGDFYFTPPNITCDFELSVFGEPKTDLIQGWKFWEINNCYQVYLTISGLPQGWNYAIYVGDQYGNAIPSLQVDGNLSSSTYDFAFFTNGLNGKYTFVITAQGDPSNVFCKSKWFYCSDLQQLSVNVSPRPMVVGEQGNLSWSVSGGISELPNGGWENNILLQWFKNDVFICDLAEATVSTSSINFIVPQNLPSNLVPGTNFQIKGSNPSNTSIPPGYVSDFSPYFDITAYYTVIVSSTGNGTVNPSGNNKIEHGDNLSISATPSNGYKFVNWTVTGGLSVQNINSASTQVTNVTSNGTVTANFTKIPYTVTVSSAGNGTVSPSGSQTVYHGDNLSISATPSNGYEFVNWTVTGGLSVQNINSASTQITNVTSNGSVTASFTKIPYTITVSSGGNGTVTPTGSQTVYHGDNLSISATPSSGYEFVNWTVTGGLSVQNTNSASTQVTNVTSDGTVTAIFKYETAIINTDKDTFNLLNNFYIIPNPVPSSSNMVSFLFKGKLNADVELLIFDALGNEIFNDSYRIINKLHYKFNEFSIWNLINYQGNKVANGTYLIVLKVNYIDSGKTEIIKRYLGIKGR